MKAILSLSEFDDFSLFDKYFNYTFKEIYPVVKRIIHENVSGHRYLYKMIRHAISDKSPSDYPFIFRFSYQQSGNQFRKIQKIAAAIHILQTSTFVIDDIFDNSNKRGGKKTIHNEYGINNAIITAELLQTISLNTIISEIMRNSFPNSTNALNLFNASIEDLYIGQYLDIYNTAKFNTTLNFYYKMISLTTGKFLSNLAKAGALLADSQKLCIEGLSNYGFYYGMALQICDDIIDITCNSSLTLKSFACDIKCRRPRIPLILALKLSNKVDHNFLIQFITHQNRVSLNEIRSIIKIMKRCGAIEECKKIACQYILKALEATSILENNFPKKMLEYLALSLLRDIGIAE